MASPGFVVIGHVVRDVLPEGWRLGGTATFAAIQASKLGLRAGVVTAATDQHALRDALPDIETIVKPSAADTSFENVYDEAGRRQRVLAQAEMLKMDDVPPEWRAAPLALLGPVCGEVPPGIGAEFHSSLVGVSAQGWLRELDDERRVRRRPWNGPPFWSGCRVLFVSDEDLGDGEDELQRWAHEVPVVAMTRARRGARVHADGSWRAIDAFPTNEVDPTGAGDVFAAAFLVRYYETDDVAESTRFASAAAACAVEAPGVEAIATRVAIEQRMAKHPEILLR